MAKRPVFLLKDSSPFYTESIIEFEFYNGFSQEQIRKSIRSLHNAFTVEHPDVKVLEISSKSETELGRHLSAFNLSIETKKGLAFTVETAFQSSKVFKYGGPYTELCYGTSKQAKTDPRLKNSGELIGFRYFSKTFKLEPRTYFYNWLYIHALNTHAELAGELMNYAAFTDIVYNPMKSINCQARAAAIYVSLRRNDCLTEALKDESSFLSAVYGTDSAVEKILGNEQLTIETR